MFHSSIWSGGWAYLPMASNGHGAIKIQNSSVATATGALALNFICIWSRVLSEPYSKPRPRFSQDQQAGHILPILRRLSKQTLDTKNLRSTGVGKEVNDAFFRNHPDVKVRMEVMWWYRYPRETPPRNSRQVREACAALINKWKAQDVVWHPSLLRWKQPCRHVGGHCLWEARAMKPRLQKKAQKVETFSSPETLVPLPRISEMKGTWEKNP